MVMDNGDKQANPNSRKGVSDAELAYAREYFRNMIFGELISAFDRAASADATFTRAELARRSQKRPEQITRWMASPGNMTIDVLSDLMFAMGTDPSSILRQPSPATASNAVIALMQRLSVEPAEAPGVAG